MPSKKSKLRLYFDECIPVQSATYLKTKGISVQHAYDLKLIQKPDQLHLNESKKLNRVLISLDKDVKRFNSVTVSDHPGVILLSTGDITPAHINKLLDKLLKHVSPDFAKDSKIKFSLDKIIRNRKGEVTEIDIK